MVLIIPYANTIKDISSYINEFKFKRWITRVKVVVVRENLLSYF